MLAAYADESFGDTDLTQKNSIPVSAFGGYVASVEEWEKFRVRWQRILDRYKVSAFHFREWAIARGVARGKPPNSSFRNNPYRGRTEETLTGFLYALAEVAGTRKGGTFGGFISLERFNKLKLSGEILLGEDHRDYCLRMCFESFIDVLKYRWPGFASKPISFVWDKTRDENWKHAIIKAYAPFEKSNPNFASLSFVDDKLCLPLQAADMVAYRIRQKTDKNFKASPSTTSHLDRLLFGDGTSGRLVFHTFQP